MLALKALLGLVTLMWALALGKVLHRRLRPRWALVPEDRPCSDELLISVVIPARNEEANIADCVASVLAQGALIFICLAAVWALDGLGRRHFFGWRNTALPK